MTPIFLLKMVAILIFRRVGQHAEKGRTAVKLLPTDVEKVKKLLLSDVCSTVIMDIPEELNINWDQTGVKYVDICRKGIQAS